MLSPKYNLARSVYRMPHPEDWTPPACHKYESRIYANYTAPPDAEVSIHIELTGENRWWVYGWSGNECMDRVGVTLTGAQDGWCAASGNLVAGDAGTAGGDFDKPNRDAKLVLFTGALALSIVYEVTRQASR